MNLMAVPPEQAALLVIDPQNAFCHAEGTLGISGVDVAPARETLTVIRQLVEGFRRVGLPVVWTRQVHLEHDAARDRKHLPSHTQRRKRVSAISGSWDAEFVDELKDLVDDPTFVVLKHRFGGFYETRLQSLLDMLGVRVLFVAGVTANACVETTLREAYLRDFDVIAVRDGIAAVRPEWTATTHEVWAQYLAVVASAAEVQDWLQAAYQPRALSMHHLLLETKDLAASVTFFIDVLGFAIRKRDSFRDGRPLVVMEQGLSLTEGGSGAKGVLQHLCFTARNVDALAERVLTSGHRIVRGPGPGPYGYTVYVEDPDGNEIELFDVAMPAPGSAGS